MSAGSPLTSLTGYNAQLCLADLKQLCVLGVFELLNDGQLIMSCYSFRVTAVSPQGSLFRATTLSLFPQAFPNK